VPKSIDLRLERFVALLIARGVLQITFEVAPEAVGHVLHE
jgi:hypothetical protein